MRAFHGDISVLRKYLSRVEAHRHANEIRQDVMWERGCGSAVGCTIHSTQYADFESYLGIPTVLAYLEDEIFYGLPPHLSLDWPLQFLGVIPVGADLRGVWGEFVVHCLGSIGGLYWRAQTKERRKAVLRVSQLFTRPVSQQVWNGDFYTAGKDALLAGGPQAQAAAAAAFSVGNPSWAGNFSNRMATEAYGDVQVDGAIASVLKREYDHESYLVAANQAMTRCYIEQANLLLALLRQA